MGGNWSKWKIGLPRLLSAVDGLCIVLAMITAQLVRFGTETAALPVTQISANYWYLGILLAAAWWVALGLWGSRNVRLIGSGGEEYKQVATVSLGLFAALAIVSYAFNLETARGYVAVALPVGLLLLIEGRRQIRRWLAGKRSHGLFTRRLILVGSPAAVAHLHGNLSAVPHAGYESVAAVLPGYTFASPTGQELPLDVASVGTDVESILEAITMYRADAIALSAGSGLKPKVIRSLGWELQDRGVSMIMAPALTDVAGPRIHTQLVSGLPLIHVSTPQLRGGQSLLKRSFDCCGAILSVLVLSPFLLIVAAMIKMDSPGTVFFSQDRVGKNGRYFRMYKFRSMVPDAEDQLASIQAENQGNGVLFKIRADPRVTRFGAFLRRFSIDELPQLWNVIRGDMSMVGPRPPLPDEVEAYEKHVHRRLKVQPGITGLWQVSGRSDLSWDDSVRLDLYYVENWNLMQDLIILFRTVRAVVGKSGAY